MRTEIYIVTHKKVNLPILEGYYPIQVGNDKNIGCLRDNNRDNISYKNSSYCELTAAYWIWKNSSADILGLTHYRRFFGEKKFSKNYNDIISKCKIEEYLTKYDLIIPQKLYIYNSTISEHYSKNYQQKDYELCRNIVEKIHPDYLYSFDYVSNRHELYIGNMMISRKDIWNSYFSWLFPILSLLEKEIDISNYDNYQKRVFGFLAERLFTIWINKNSNYKVLELPVFNTETYDMREIIKNDFKKYFLGFNNKIKFLKGK